jgi:hypothetical protein
MAKKKKIKFNKNTEDILRRFIFTKFEEYEASVGVMLQSHKDAEIKKCDPTDVLRWCMEEKAREARRVQQRQKQGEVVVAVQALDVGELFAVIEDIVRNGMGQYFQPLLESDKRTWVEAYNDECMENGSWKEGEFMSGDLVERLCVMPKTCGVLGVHLLRVCTSFYNAARTKARTVKDETERGHGPVYFRESIHAFTGTPTWLKLWGKVVELVFLSGGGSADTGSGDDSCGKQLEKYIKKHCGRDANDAARSLLVPQELINKGSSTHVLKSVTKFALDGVAGVQRYDDDSAKLLVPCQMMGFNVVSLYQDRFIAKQVEQHSRRSDDAINNMSARMKEESKWWVVFVTGALLRAISRSGLRFKTELLLLFTASSNKENADDDEDGNYLDNSTADADPDEGDEASSEEEEPYADDDEQGHDYVSSSGSDEEDLEGNECVSSGESEEKGIGDGAKQMESDGADSSAAEVDESMAPEPMQTTNTIEVVSPTYEEKLKIELNRSEFDAETLAESENLNYDIGVSKVQLINRDSLMVPTKRLFKFSTDFNDRIGEAVSFKSIVAAHKTGQRLKTEVVVASMCECIELMNSFKSIIEFYAETKEVELPKGKDYHQFIEVSSRFIFRYWTRLKLRAVVNGVSDSMSKFGSRTGQTTRVKARTKSE